jgi:endonuclease/exonuclease/phosphatase family metal-dependent hydrolase
MKLVSWNIKAARIDDGNSDKTDDKEDLDFVISILKEQDADIICIQESHTLRSNTEENQVKSIAEALGFPNYINVPLNISHLDEKYFMSLGIISKFPINYYQLEKLKNPNLIKETEGIEWYSRDKGFIVAKLDYEGEELYLSCGHLLRLHAFGRDFMEEDFTSIRNEIERILKPRHKAPSLICADMNYGPMQEFIPAIMNEGFQDIFENQVTTRSRRKVDHILTSKEWKVKEKKILEVQTHHFPCIVELELKDSNL